VLKLCRSRKQFSAGVMMQINKIDREGLLAVDERLDNQRNKNDFIVITPRSSCPQIAG
jgi:hypothetical protein